DGAWFTGALDETRIWKVARTQCEIQTFMNCEVVSTPTTLVANYHFNQGVDQGSNLSVNTLTDASGSIRTGTLSAFDLTGLTSNWIGNGAVVSNYTTFTTPNVEIDVRGAGNSIIDGNTSTSPVDYTDFNGALTRTYTIHNLNSAALAIGVPYFTGTDANQFSVTTLPPASLAGSSSVAIVVAFTPTSTGVKTATFNIPNSDCDEPLYDFRIVAIPPAAEALNFNGGTQDVETGSNLLELGLSDFTIETWIKTTGNDMGILTCSDGDGTWEPGEKSLLIENDGHLEFVGYGCDFIHASQTYSVNDGNWHHVAITWDLQSSPNGIGKIYIDGVDRTSSSTYTANTTNLGTFKIGLQNYGESTLNFSGTMDEFRIWNVARSQCEIQSYMQCEITNTLTNLLANYHFNQGAPFLNNSSVTTLTDAAAVPHTGTLTNFVLTGSVSNWVSPGGIVSGSVTPASITASLIVSGNGNNVPSGIVTTTLNNTDFAANPSRSFSITNAGGGTLNIGSIYFTGPAAAQFSVTSSPSLAVTTGTTGFTIAYTPTALGSFSAVVNISTNDCINPTYSFVVTASTIPASALNFDGTNDFVALSSGTNIPLGNSPYTIESWIKPTAFGDCGIVGWGNYGTTNEVNGFRLGVGGLLINYWWGNDLMATV
ncbi:MAG: choice-of-anchor D domain-containing protein, partial [Bacteroidia bacterium]|nr:choice-of-anchor D domain-containing protein [Bacteroidia bacterium]